MVFLALLGAYLMLGWFPIDRGGESRGIEVNFVLFWIAGGALTLSFLLLAGRKTS